MYPNSVQILQEQRQHLIDARFTAPQAEAIMKVVEERQLQSIQDLATKRDLEELRLATKRDLVEVRTELKHEIAEVRTELKQDIANVRTELKEVRTELKHDIAMLDGKLTHRMTIGFIAVGALSLASPHLPDIIRFITTLMK